MNIYSNISEERIFNLLEREALGLELEIVRVRLGSGKKGGVSLQIMLERQDGTPLRIEDCERASKVFAMFLDNDDPIETKYRLEVSSLGVNRPLTRIKDFEACIGERVKLTTFQQLDGRKSFIGIIKICGTDGFSLVLEENKETIEISYDAIKDATLLKY